MSPRVRPRQGRQRRGTSPMGPPPSPNPLRGTPPSRTPWDPTLTRPMGARPQISWEPALSPHTASQARSHPIPPHNPPPHRWTARRCSHTPWDPTFAHPMGPPPHRWTARSCSHTPWDPTFTSPMGPPPHRWTARSCSRRCSVSAATCPSMRSARRAKPISSSRCVLRPPSLHFTSLHFTSFRAGASYLRNLCVTYPLRLSVASLTSDICVHRYRSFFAGE